MFILGLVFTSIVLVASQSLEQECNRDCRPSVKQCNIYRPLPQKLTRTAYPGTREGKRDTTANTNDFDMSKQNTGLLGVIVPKINKDYSARLPTKQQLQTLENYVLFDYLHDMQNYE